MIEAGRAEFHALGTGCVVMTSEAVALSAAHHEVIGELARIDAACSRFRSDSDLERVNNNPGRPVAVSACLLDALDVAFRAAQITDGDLDPTIGSALITLGYDRDFETLRGADAAGRIHVRRVRGWRSIAVDRAQGTVSVPNGIRLDLGATAKAWAADCAAGAAACAVDCGVLVSIGGDIAVANAAPGAGWAVALADRHDAPFATRRSDGHDPRRRPGDVVDDGAAVAGGRHDGAPHSRPAHVATRGRVLAHRDGRGRERGRRQHRIDDLHHSRRPRARVARRDSPAGPARRRVRVGQRGERLARRRAARGGAVVIAATSGKAFWYATRGTGVVALILLTASVVIGIVTSIRLETRGWPRYVIELVHKNVSLLVLVFLGLHIVTTVQDGYVPIHYLDALIPFRSPYRTFWLGLGTVAFDLLVALVVTSLLRVRLGYRSWRFVHWFAYVCWPVAFVHALGTGSDTRYGWSVVLDLAMLAAVVAAAAWRVAVDRDRVRPFGWGAVAVAPFVVVAIVVWALAGPLRPGWARSTARRTTVATVAPVAPSSTHTNQGGSQVVVSTPVEAKGFRGELHAVRLVGPTAADGRRVISIRGTIHSTPALALDMQLRGLASGPGIVLDSGVVTLGPAGATHRWNGTVTSLVGTRLVATVTDRTGAVLHVVMQLQIDRTIGSATGVVTGRPGGTQ